MLEARDHGMAPAMLGQGQFRAAPTDILRVHDLVGFALFQDAILVNAGAVSEGVLSDDGFAAGDMQAAHAADDARSLQDLASDDAGMHARRSIRCGF